ncbi:MAG: WD40 repeat domain-containing protein [Verrucomicrobiales bacterium]|nr:WD40 repeat domain-containing protein [Verrucomicrobiales bacterium]
MSEEVVAFEPKPIGTITPECALTTVRYSPCGRVLAGTGFDQAIHRWDLAKMENPGDEKMFAVPGLEKVNGHNGFVSGLEFHPKREIAFSADSWGQLKAWPYLAEKPEPIWALPEAHDGWLRDLAIGDDGDWIATCGRDGICRIFSTIDGGLLAKFGGHDGEDVFAIAVHPSGKWAVSGDLRGRILQWEVKTGKIVREFDGADFHTLHRLQDLAGLRKLYFSPDGNTLIAGGSLPTGGANFRGRAHVRMFDFESGKVAQDVVIGDEAKDVFAHDVALHPEGCLVACTTGQSGSGNLILHRPGEEEPIFKSNKGTINCHGLALSPDAKQVAVSATNRGSNANGRRLDKEGNYPHNHSPIFLFELV